MELRKWGYRVDIPLDELVCAGGGERLAGKLKAGETITVELGSYYCAEHPGPASSMMNDEISRMAGELMDGGWIGTEREPE